MLTDRAREAETQGAPPGAESPSPTFAPGTLLDGKYAVERVLAEGGLGVVVRAKHLGLDQAVAIKHLKPKVLGNRMLVERFEREGRLAAQIASEHVVRVLDVGRTSDAGPYLVMEFLVGRDLGSVVEGGRIEVPRAVDYVLQACDALADAHALGIVHRDIKPDNLFLAQRPSSSDVVKIIDFGISRAPRVRNEDGTWKRETQEDERFGTPLYMSPEQLRSPADVDHRTDIWSLGIVLYELIEGRPPFDGENLPDLYANILRGAPARSESCPEALRQVVLRCLQKDPSARYRNVAELALALQPFAPTAAGRVSRIRRVIVNSGFSVRPPATTAVSAGAPEPISVATDLTSDAPPLPPVQRGRTFAIVTSAALATLAVVVVLVARPRPHAVTSAGSPRIEAASSLPALSTAAPPPVVLDVPSEPITPAPRPVVPPARTARPPVPGPALATTRPAPPAAPAASGRRALFGDRK